MKRGIIKRYRPFDGFGFITDIETKEDSFLHFTTVMQKGIDERRLSALMGREVLYESEWKNGKPSPEVTNLRLLD